MKWKIFNICIFFLSLVLTSCNIGVFYIDLGNHYAWVESREIVKIKEETEKSLYYDVLIRPQVLNYDYDDKYVIVYQVYDGSEYYSIFSKEDKNEKDSLYAQFAILKEMKHCYWIIDKEADKVMGPMTKSDFDKKCVDLHVKAKLRKFHEKKFWDSSIEYDPKADSIEWEKYKAEMDSIAAAESEQ